MQERTKQGGSVLVFSIIGVVLAAAVIGLVFLVNKRAEDRLAGPLFEVPGTSEESNSANDESGDRATDDKSNSANDDTVSGDQPSDQNNSGAANDPDESGDAADDKSGEPSSQPIQPAPADDKSGTETDEPLPATGPTEDALSGLMLAVMAGLIVAYARSRV